VRFFGEKPVDMDKVLAEFEKRTADSLNTKLDMSFDVPGEYFNKLKLSLTAAEEIDLAFDAPWRDMYSNISKGYYNELDKYFNNDAYPGLKQAFSPEFLESAKVNGHIYTIPVTNAFYDIPIVIYRKDLREKYGLEPIDSYDELKVFAQKVEENEQNYIGFKGGRMSFHHMFANFEEKQTTYRSFPYEIGGAGAKFNLVLSPDGKKVLGATTIGDPVEEYASFPAPYNNPEFFYGHLDKHVEFSPFLGKDPLAANQATTVKYGASETTLFNFAQKRQELKQAEGEGADYEFFIYNEAARNKQEGAIGTEYKAWNFIGVPVTSKNIDRTMKFLDWLFSSQDNHDLFELGIEGVHWTKEGDKYYRSTEETKNYRFPAYELTWNPTLSRKNADNPQEILDYMDYQSQDQAFYKLALAGFTFNSDPVKTELAKVQPKFSDADKVLSAGVDPKWRESAAKLNKELRALGLEKIRAELVKQAQDFLDKQTN
jgi:ABC-type glycerol-3-phosphate transport system substrate-binding protein